MSRQTTQNKILDAAERLFAERGFADTSLRLITSEADVNLASVNYHFGSKKALIKAVLARYLEQFMPRLSNALDELLAAEQQPTLHQVFDSFVEPMLALNNFRSSGTNIFMQLLGRGYSDSQGHLRWFLTTQYGDVLTKITAAVKRANPELSPGEFFWRMHFTLGTVVFTLASNEALRDIARSEFNENLDVEGLVRRLVPFLAAGVGAPVAANSLNDGVSK
ncbi:TetR/AcrR family transcriptional regulator [Neiella sp. HB171785]|uniref:TetR/AcrR family transcriptional regulator n=1 Tax=Neiella litorisoli TaxID=2771431 RepID=A0A8J6QF78_9GAMM|nr:TetR/AcrR family transcriptional regulator [Neiella litorisoli]MBD1388569.1 TetR/AcrR family transcriptional regulator [Neiella litorisoli]